MSWKTTAPCAGSCAQGERVAAPGGERVKHLKINTGATLPCCMQS